MTAEVHSIDGPTPPRNFEAEQGVLGAILSNPRAYDKVSSTLRASHFADPLHGRIFEACAALIQSGREATPTTLKHVFDADEAYREIGGAQYLAELAQVTPTIINAPHYAEIIVELAQRREMVAQAHNLLEAAYATDIDQNISDVCGESLTAIEAIAAGTEGGWIPIGDAAETAIAHAIAARDSDGRTAGIPTGLTALDSLLGGLPRGEVTIGAGRPAMGKTGFGCSVAWAAARAGEPVGFFSIEMQAHQIATRMLAVESGIDGGRIRLGRISDDEIALLRQAKERLAALPIHIDEASPINIEQIMARARAAHRRGNANLIIIDYLGYVEATDRKERMRTYQLEHVTRNAKQLAKSLDVPVLLLAQISRKTESRDDKRPTMEDLKDSGAIEQDAAVILGLYRHEYYVARAEPKGGGRTERQKVKDDEERAEWEADRVDARGKAEIIIIKNRFGAANRTVIVKFDGATSGFSDLAQHNEPPPYSDKNLYGGEF